MKVISQKLSATLNNLTRSISYSPDVDLVLVSGNPFSLEEPMFLDTLKKSFPNASIAGCSSDGVFVDGQSHENSVIYTAINFDNTEVKQARINLPDDDRNEYASGKLLAEKLVRDDLISVIIFCEGTKLDCHQILEGVKEVLGEDVIIWGGLAADKTGFDYTVVMDHEGIYDDGVVAVGLYGNRLVVNSNSSSFDNGGIEIDITTAQDNVILEINNQPAGDVFASLIGDRYGSSMSFVSHYPIISLDPKTRKPMFSRSVYFHEEETNNLYCVGTIPEGLARIVCMVDTESNLDDAVQTSMKLKDPLTEFSLIASCAGRKGAMKTEWLKESILIQENLGNVPNFGFYAYGEIAKCHGTNTSLLHNHTLSMITLYET